MEFCPKCGSIILVQVGKAKCASCGFKPKKIPTAKAAEIIKPKEEIPVIKEKEESTYPVVDIECGKCKNPKAYFWTIQTRAADESETKFYKCTKCEHTWREYR